MFSNLQFRSPDDAAPYVQEKTKNLNGSLRFLYHVISSILDTVPQLPLNISLLYSQAGDTEDISFVSHTLLSCIPGRRLHEDKNRMLLCGNSCEYRNLKAAFVLSFWFVKN